MMVFCSMLAYKPESAQRFAAERCLWKLLKQLDDEDAFLIFEKVYSDYETAWKLKPKVLALALMIAQKDEWACWVDADIDFRDGFVWALKDFLSNIHDKNRPTIVMTKIWQRGSDNWVEDEKIEDFRKRSMICQQVWDFYFGTGLIVANKAFLAYIDEWQTLTNKSQWYPEETALVTLAHKYRNHWQIIWLPDKLHFVGWLSRQTPDDAFAVHIGSQQINKWLEVTFNASS